MSQLFSIELVFRMRNQILVLVSLLISLIAYPLSATALSIPAQNHPTSGDVYYLDVNHPQASDDAEHGSYDNPWKSFYYALRQLNPGDTLLIREGIYREDGQIILNEKHTGYEESQIEVKAYPGEIVIIQDIKPIRFQGANWWTIDGLVFEKPNENSNYIQLGLHRGLDQERTISAEHITIRNCEFRNGSKTIIVMNYAYDNVIENNYFHHVRPGRPFHDDGWEVTAIAVRYVANNIEIKNNRFEDIGSDGVHIGADGYREGADIKKVSIVDNRFWINRPYKGMFGNVGENGIDVKWVKGPVLISGNRIHGFRPTTPEQDASGADGAGIVVHNNAQNVIVERNVFVKNTRHIELSRGPAGNSGGTTRIIIGNNYFGDARTTPSHEGIAILIRDIGTVSINRNTIISTDDTYYLKANKGGSVEFMYNVVIGGWSSIDNENVDWDYYGNLFIDPSIHPSIWK